MKSFLFLLPLALLLGCQKTGPDPAAQLPPATQTGAGTFGCLVNGQPWTPQGNDGFSNYSVSYDPTYHHGTLAVSAYRVSGSGKDEVTIGFASDSVRTQGNYSIVRGGPNLAVVTYQTGCQYHSTDIGTYGRGAFNITRLDLKAGVVSGTFAFTLYKPGCDSVRVTQGRFDRQL